MHSPIRSASRWAAAGMAAWGLAIAVTSPAHAGAGVVTTTVTPLSANVTYSSAPGAVPVLVTYVAYEVQVSNAGGNTINNIRFTGTTAVTDPGESAVFASAEGASCIATNAAGTAIECTVGQLTAGAAAPPFVVFFKAPARASTAPSPDEVSLAWTTFFAEGTGGLTNSIPQNSTITGTADPVQLGTDNPTLVKSAVPKSGGSLFTGAGNAATAADPWTTTVTVPPGATSTTAVIAEAALLTTCAADLLDCRTTTLTIPGSFAQLVIVLRRDASTIAKGAKIASARIYYNHDDTSSAWGPEVLACSATGGPQPGVPCLAARTEYTKKNSPSPDWLGDWEFVIYALDNGKYIN